MEDKQSKERILEAAIRLFSRKGYSATGLREVVREAGVSVAMVNYHFGSKQELLKEIVKKFFDMMAEKAEEILGTNDLPELKMRRWIRAVVAEFREHREMVRTTITELPHDAPEIVQFKAEAISRLVNIFLNKVLPTFPESVRNRIRPEIAGPSMMGAIAFHFLMRPVVERVFQVEFDDKFYDGYADELADLILYGLFRAEEPPPRRKDA